MILLKSLGALCVGLARHLSAEIGELLAELFDLCLGLEVLEGLADGDGTEGAGVQFWVPLHDVERALRREGVVVVMDARDDLAFFRVRVGGDGEVWTCGSVDGFGGWHAR